MTQSNVSKGKRRLRGDHCECPTCGLPFNSASAFDKHRVGEFTLSTPDAGRRCLTPAEMLAKGMAVNAGGWWVGSENAVSRVRHDSRSGDRTRPLARLCPWEIGRE